MSAAFFTVLFLLLIVNVIAESNHYTIITKKNCLVYSRTSAVSMRVTLSQHLCELRRAQPTQFRRMCCWLHLVLYPFLYQALTSVDSDPGAWRSNIVDSLRTRQLPRYGMERACSWGCTGRVAAHRPHRAPPPHSLLQARHQWHMEGSSGYR